MAEKPKKEKRTVNLPIPSKEWEEAALALSREAKNLYNTVTFLIRQVNFAYDYDAQSSEYTLRDNLHDNQRRALSDFNSMIEQINETRIEKAKFKPNLDKNGEVLPPKLLTLLSERMDKSPLYTVLDQTLLDNVARISVGTEGYPIYRRLPAATAQQVVRSVIDNWKGILSSLVDWAKSPSKYSGRPKFPKFIDKKGYFPLEIPFASMTKGFPRPKVFHPLELLEDRSEALQEVFYDYDLKSSVETSCLKRGWDDFLPQHVRIVVKRRRVKVEAVLDLALEFPEGSFLKKLYDEHGETIRGFKKSTDREKFLLNTALAEPSLNLAGIDFGETNVATLAFSTGHRAVVHSGQRWLEMVKHYDEILDKLKSKLSTSRLKELTTLQTELVDRGERLPKAELIQLRQELKLIYDHPNYQALTNRLERKKADLEHKISTDLVRQCAKNRIDVLAVGRNIGMKHGKDWRKDANRQSYRIAHARLLSMIRYKAEQYGIAVFTTEESYTSKSSFFDNDEMKTYQKEVIETDETTETADPAPVKTVYSGKRHLNRNWFIRHNAGCGPSRVHADVNGAFNIIRKIFKTFRYHVGLSLKFNVRRISPRLGAVAPLSCQTG